MLTLCFIYRIFRWQYELMVSTILASVVIGILATLWLFNFGGFDLILTALGKEPTLTGRTGIWQYSWDMIQLRPWQGYGLKAFWHGLQGPSAYVELALTAPVPYAHNGFLDILLAIGFLGLSTFLVGLLSAVVKALALLRKTNTSEGFWPLLFLSYVFIYNVAEGVIANFNGLYWAIYTAIFFSLLIARDNIYSPGISRGGRNTGTFA
jgi:O-antigen ligase